MGRISEWTFFQRTHIDGQQCMKRCSTSLITGEIQTKITMGYYFTPTKMVLIKRQKIASVSQNVEDLNLHMLLMEM